MSSSVALLIAGSLAVVVGTMSTAIAVIWRFPWRQQFLGPACVLWGLAVVWIAWHQL